MIENINWGGPILGLPPKERMIHIDSALIIRQAMNQQSVMLWPDFLGQV